MKKLSYAFLCLVALASNSATAVARHDVLECGLPGGGKFVLTAKYDWSPIAKILPGHAAERLNQENFKITFKPKNSLSGIDLQSISVVHSLLNRVEAAQELCQSFGIFDDIPYYGLTYFLPKRAKKFIKTTFDFKLRIFDADEERPEKLRKELSELKAWPSATAIRMQDRLLVSETALVNVGSSVVAVFQSKSADNGQTWSDPVVTREAAIFTLGIRVQEQDFIARPVRINGTKIPAKFPPKSVQARR